ncbi:MAG: LppX_LprAFG lipoprotein [Acidimicrobiia bacterium]
MRRLGLTVTAVMVATLSACGSGSSHGATGLGATKLVAASADKAVAAKTARMSGEVSFEVLGKRQTLPLDGVLDFGSGAFEFSFDMSQLGIPGAGGAKIVARMVDGVMYMKLGDLAAAGDLSSVTGGKSWVKLDMSQFGVKSHDSGGELGDANPGGSLDALRGAGDVQKVGTETVRGVATTHYRATVDPKKALDEAPAELRDRVRKGLEMFHGSIPVEVWIDGDGQARKVSMDVDTKTGRVSTTMEYYDFGVAVNVSAPPADDVFDYSDFLNSVRGLTGSGAGDRPV